MCILCVFDPISFFRCFRIIEAIQRTYQITGNSSDLLKFHRRQIIADTDLLTVKIQRDRFDITSRIFLFYITDVVMQFTFLYI